MTRPQTSQPTSLLWSRRRLLTVPAGAVLATVLSACSDDEPGDAVTGPGPDPGEGPNRIQPEGFALVAATLTDADGASRSVMLWSAATVEERALGLMNVTDIGEADAMLFSFETEDIHEFYMWQTPMSLEIAYFDDDGRLVGSEEMTPCLADDSSRCLRFSPDVPFRHAIEWPADSAPVWSEGTVLAIEREPTGTSPSGR
ncbi:hypothetical protein BH24ACT5_BH24ACT5_07400 [soil metagenome]